MKIIIQNNVPAYGATDAYEANGTEQAIVSVPDGTDITTYVYLGTTLDSAQAALVNALEPQRLAVQNAGLVYTFAAAVPAVLASDGVTVVTPAVPAVTGTIQTRDQTQYPDIANINGATTAALVLTAQNVTAAALSFRDEQNITHAMTPAQMIAMGMAVSEFITLTYSAKWTIQQSIGALTTLAAAQAFDITQGWPA